MGVVRVTGRLGGRRGQLVLAAAALVAVALIPVVAAYLQLGGAVAAHDPTAVRPGTHADEALSRSVDRTLPGLPASYAWTERDDAVSAFRDALEPRLDALRESRLADGTAYVVSYDAERASAWAADSCPGGPDRQFGPCRTRGGVVVQSRDGRTHIVAAAFQVRIVGPDGDAVLQVVAVR